MTQNEKTQNEKVVLENSKTNEVIRTQKIQSKDEVIKIVNENGVGTFVLSLDNISNKVFVNTRGSIVDGRSRVITSPQHIANIARTIGQNRNNEQLQAINCAISRNRESEDKNACVIGVYEGFTRYEAMCRNALADLIDKWNEVNELNEGDSDFIIPINAPKGTKDEDYIPDIDYEHEKQRLKIYEAGGEWKDLYIKCLSSYPVKVEIVRNISDKSAFTKGVLSAYARQKPPVWSMANNILNMINVFKMKGVEIARNLGVTSALISQYKSVAEIPENLKELLEENEEVNTEENRKMLDVCIDEFIRRASLPVDDKCSIQISHSKAIATLLRNHKQHSLTFNRAIKLMKLLCCIDVDGKLNMGSQTLNLSVLEQHIDSAKRAGTKATEFNLTDGIEELLSTSLSVEDIASEQASTKLENEINGKDEEDDDDDKKLIDSLIKEVDESEEVENVNIEDVDDDGEDIIDDENNESQDASQDTVEVSDVDDDDNDSDDDDLSLSDLIDNADIGEDENDGDNDGDDDIGDLVGSLLGEEDEDNDGKKGEKDDSGKKKSSTIENVETRVTVKSPDKLMSKIMTAKLMISTFIEEGEENDASTINWVEVLINLSSIVTLSDVLNDKEANNKYQAIIINMSEAYSEFINSAINFCREKMPAGKWNEIIKSLNEFDKTKITE